MFKTIEDVDWANWDPVTVATLLFVIKDGRVLLIHKKRGFGKGKINGPGGKLEPGETPLECAIRETQEELLITPRAVEFAGELRFQFTDGNSIHGHVFTATDFDGVPTETEEAAPEWFSLDQLPYERMWEDDHIWFPYMLKGERFAGRYVFDGDHMLDQHMDLG